MHFVLWLIFRQPHPDFISVRLKNLGTTDKKSSHKIKHKKIPRVHIERKEEEKCQQFLTKNRKKRSHIKKVR